MAEKEFVVFGLGKFGESVARTLVKCGCEVLVVDKDEEKIQEIADVVTYAVRADITDQEALKSLGIGNMDGAVVAIADNMEASIMATILAKELGVGNVIAKAQNELHAKVLKKIGADAIIFPEKEMGVRIARNLSFGTFLDTIELSSSFSMVETAIPAEWIGKSLRQLNLRNRKLNVIAIKKGDQMDISPDPDRKLTADEILIVVGYNKDLSKLKNR